MACQGQPPSASVTWRLSTCRPGKAKKETLISGCYSSESERPQKQHKILGLYRLVGHGVAEALGTIGLHRGEEEQGVLGGGSR